MAGVYLHIPFCRRACHYCDFHFTTNLNNAENLVGAMLREMEIRRDYLNGESIKTIYFGGGTPSLLHAKEIERLLNAIYRTRNIESELELTLEANPEDLSSTKLSELKSIGVNRLSLGTQSFIDRELKWMNRMHTAAQAEKVIREAQKLGFNNISIDLIFGLPNQSMIDWEFNLNKAIELDIQHISSYSLTVEPKTVLSNRIQKGKQLPPDENTSAECFQLNMEFLPSNGFEHYEISNFAKAGFVSKHNSSYWLSENYLGIGPSAHSFNGTERYWNVKSNGGYIQKLQDNRSFFETEKLTEVDRINEHLMTGLRTKWGAKKNVLENISVGSWPELKRKLKTVNASYYHLKEDALVLTPSGKLKADFICSELFVA